MEPFQDEEEVIEEGVLPPFDEFAIADSVKIVRAPLVAGLESSDSDLSESSSEDQPPTPEKRPRLVNQAVEMELRDAQGTSLASATIQSTISRDRQRKNVRVDDGQLKRSRKKSARQRIAEKIRQKGVGELASQADKIVAEFPRQALNAKIERTCYSFVLACVALLF